ncbi:MAG TPA: aminotransferase class I/II-fold pyridoxal phosphate-dependent enzyme [Thermoanaerobaculia bacterium]|nr:aminotransferase class I/II-fold pyridoxal phosphate-dependent enzyme [Thermoanaerobaculia bacterium]
MSAKRSPSSRFRPLSKRTEPFAESVIREMTRIGAEVGGINLAQGLPDFEPPRQLVAALRRALAKPGQHQYTFPWGAANFREAIARKTARFNGFSPDPDTQITVTCGVSEAACAAIFALTETGDEVVMFEPWYENYLPACVLAGVTPRFVPLSEPDYALDAGALAKVLNRRTRLILVNTPANPSGRVFTRAELSEIARLCQRHGVIAVTDEIYEHIWSEGHPHVSLASLSGMEDRTVTLSGLGKSYAVTGWRVGWAIAREPLTALLRKVHDYLTICAPAPFQEAGVTALGLPESFYVKMRQTYARRRRILLEALGRAGLVFTPPEGAYYVMADARTLGWKDDRAFVDFLARKVGVVAVPGSSFYTGRGGRTRARFNFAKREETLREAARRLAARPLTA